MYSQRALSRDFVHKSFLSRHVCDNANYRNMNWHPKFCQTEIIFENTIVGLHKSFNYFAQITDKNLYVVYDFSQVEAGVGAVLFDMSTY